VAIVIAVVVAEAAVVLLRPRDGVIESAPVRATSYFSPAEIDRAEDFRSGQRLLYGGIVIVQMGLLATLVARPPRRLRGPFRRPLVVGAVAGAMLSVAVDVAPLPLQVAQRERARDVGLVTQGWGGYAQDRALSAAIGALLAGAGAAAGLALVRRSPRRWWIPGSVVVVAFGALSVYASPLVLDPLFNDFRRLPPGPTRSDVLRLADRAGLDVGSVYVVDASKRTTAVNAYVTGLGHSKRVVLYDNLVNDFTRDETRLVIAHELGHVHHHDVPRGLLFLALVTPPALFAAALATRRLSPAGAWEQRPGPAVLPALALSIALLAAVLTTVSNQLSRRVEARADSYALRLTGEPEPFIAFERRIALKNVSDPDPPDWWQFLRGTHPTTLERIGIGEAFRRGERP
jgi:STE24 endopeptidase